MVSVSPVLVPIPRRPVGRFDWRVLWRVCFLWPPHRRSVPAVVLRARVGDCASARLGVSPLLRLASGEMRALTTVLGLAPLPSFHEEPRSKQSHCDNRDDDESHLYTCHIAVASRLACASSFECCPVVPATVDCGKIHACCLRFWNPRIFGCILAVVAGLRCVVF